MFVHLFVCTFVCLFVLLCSCVSIYMCLSVFCVCVCLFSVYVFVCLFVFITQINELVLKCFSNYFDALTGAYYEFSEILSIKAALSGS